jgi:hypothetical protein
MPDELLLKLSDLRLDDEIQMRVALDEAAIANYADDLERGDQLPAIEVVYDGEIYWLACGFHRCEAHERAGREMIACNVYEGTRIDAIKRALRSNSTHGVRLTDDDKRKKVNYVLDHLDELGVDDNDREIARFCRVSRDLVAAVRKDRASGASPILADAASMTGECSEIEQHVSFRHPRSGQHTRMRTDNIVAANRRRAAERRVEADIASLPEAEQREHVTNLLERRFTPADSKRVAKDNAERYREYNDKYPRRTLKKLRKDYASLPAAEQAEFMASHGQDVARPHSGAA